MRRIDADAIKKWIDESVCQYGNRYSADIINMFGLFTEIIDKAPTIEETTGEWIREEKTFEDLSGAFETYTRSTCSVCNQANGWGEVPYCPWCGAKMERRHDGHGETNQKQEG